MNFNDKCTTAMPYGKSFGAEVLSLFSLLQKEREGKSLSQSDEMTLVLEIEIRRMGVITLNQQPGVKTSLVAHFVDGRSRVDQDDSKSSYKGC